MTRTPKPAPKGVKAKAKRRGSATGPPVRGRRGHSTIDQQAGFAEWIDRQLLMVPKPTYDQMLERLRSTGFYASRAALARYGFEFEVRRREAKLIADRAVILASDQDANTRLALETAIGNIAAEKVFTALESNTSITESTQESIDLGAKLIKASALREKTKHAINRGIRAAAAMIRAEMQKLLGEDPALLKKILAIIDRAEQEVAQR